MDSLEEIFKKRILGNLFFIMDSFCRKDRKILIFTARGGKSFYDNSRYLFLSFLKNYSSEFKIFWCCSTKQSYKKLLKVINRKNLLYQYSMKGILTIMKAKTLFFTHGVGDIKDLKLCVKKRNLILLWHAVAFKDKQKRLLSEPVKKKSPYKLIVASSKSDKEQKIRRDMKIISEEKVKVTGLPRHDFLFDSILQKKSNTNLDKKIILYCPTYRRNQKTRFFPFEDLNMESLGEFLEKNDIFMYLRPHYKKNSYYVDKKILNSLSKRVLLLDWERLEDTNEFLPGVDILMTDYSSIFIDFLILDRPLIFIPYDIEEYFKENGLLYNYDYITPGPKIKSQKELLYWIERYIENPEIYGQERDNIKKIFFDFNDGQAFRRIYEEIKKIL